jgi:hypothetical protein
MDELNRDLDEIAEIMAFEKDWREHLTPAQQLVADHLENHGWTGQLSVSHMVPRTLTFTWSNRENYNPQASGPDPYPGEWHTAFDQASRRARHAMGEDL